MVHRESLGVAPRTGRCRAGPATAPRTRHREMRTSHPPTRSGSRVQPSVLSAPVRPLPVVRYRSVRDHGNRPALLLGVLDVPASITSSPSGPSHPHRGTLVPRLSIRPSSHDRGLARSSRIREAHSAGRVNGGTSSDPARVSAVWTRSRGTAAHPRVPRLGFLLRPLGTVSLTELGVRRLGLGTSVGRKMASAWHRSSAAAAGAPPHAPRGSCLSRPHWPARRTRAGLPGGDRRRVPAPMPRNITACCGWSAGSSRTFLAYASHGRRNICTSLGEKWSSSSALERMADAPTGRTLPRLAFSSDVSTGAGGEAMGAPSRWGARCQPGRQGLCSPTNARPPLTSASEGDERHERVPR